VHWVADAPVAYSPRMAVSHIAKRGGLMAWGVHEVAVASDLVPCQAMGSDASLIASNRVTPSDSFL
jgi:hypothetical protein